MCTIDENNDVFISYQWDIKPQVKEICEELKKHFKIWRDDDDMRHTRETLSQQLANAIRKSKVILCFLTQKYALSKNCKREIKYSSEYDKSIIIVDIEKINKDKLDPEIGFIISGLVRINCYHNSTNWMKENRDEIVKAIRDNLNEIEKKNPINRDLILQRYKIIKNLAEGAQSIVFLVEDFQNDNKKKAMKKFKDYSISKEAIENEVKLTRNIEHDNLIKYYDFHSIEKFDFGRYFIHFMLTEYYEDGSLDDKIKLNNTNNTEFSYYQKKAWCLQLLDGISYLHSKNIIHRDIKPSNIFLSQDLNHLALGDLGHAKRIEIEQNKSFKTISKLESFGTISYNAPEVIKNKYDENHQTKFDVWSFGCTVYEMQQQKMLFYDKSRQVLEKRIRKFKFSELVLNEDEPTINQLIKMSLIKNPGQRANPNELIQIVKEFDQQKPAGMSTVNTKLFDQIKRFFSREDESCSINEETSIISEKENDIKAKKELIGHKKLVWTLAVLPNGDLASGSWDNTIIIWDVSLGQQKKQLIGHTQSVNALVVLPNGDLASGSNDSRIIIWDVSTGNQRTQLIGYNVLSLSVLLNGDLACGSWTEGIVIWDLNSGKIKKELIGHTDSIDALAVLPNGDLASGSSDKSIIIWDMNLDNVKKKLKGHTKLVCTLVVLPNGDLASGSADATIIIWDVISGKRKKKLKGHTFIVYSLAVLGDGNLVSGSGDETIVVWDVNVGSQKKILEDHSRDVLTLAVLPNGDLASGSSDKTILILDSNSVQ